MLNVTSKSKRNLTSGITKIVVCSVWHAYIYWN